MTRLVLPIEGMHCAGCVDTIQHALATTHGVSSAVVNLATGKAMVEFDDATTNAADLVHAVREAGYQSDTTSVSFAVLDLHYAASVAGLEQATEVPGGADGESRHDCRVRTAIRLKLG